MNETQNDRISRIVTAILQHQRFLIATHIRPDGDAAGSLLALTFMLRQLGKEAIPYCRDPLPVNLEFLPGASSIQHEWSGPLRYDMAILVDCGELKRVGSPMDEALRELPLVINIDHHISDSPFGDLYWVNSSASSTCEMLYDLSRSLSIVINPDIASQLYTGIVTDTGSFRFGNTSCRVFEIAAKLVAEGAQPHDIAQELYDSAPAERIHLLNRLLSTVTFYADNRLATAELTRGMFLDTNTTPADSDGFINQLRSVKTVELAMLFREDENGLINVSMRSKGSVDVASFAQRFKGGGHRNAAAFRVSGSLENVRRHYTLEALNHFWARVV